MALITLPEIHKFRKPAMVVQRKPLMLKDFLIDDLSSCSSSGFKTFPRRHCCTTVRFLLDVDLKSFSQPHLRIPPPKSIHSSKNQKQKQLLRRSRSSAAACNTISALQRASGAVINAVRNLQFHSCVKSSTSSSARKEGLLLLLPRSISRRLWRKSFWTKAVEEEKDVGRYRSFRELLQEQDTPSDIDETTDSSKTNSNSWGESEFSLNSSSSSSSSESSSIGSEYVAAVEAGKSSLTEKRKVSGRVGVSAGEDSIIETPTTATSTSTSSPQNAHKGWVNKEEEKEQFSPVSVLDCPLEDEDDETSTNSSPFRCRLARLEGTQHKFTQKITRFDNLSQLEPLELERRMAVMSEINNRDDRDNKTEEKAGELAKQLMIIKTRSSALSRDLKADKLVVDLFIERIGGVESSSKESEVMEEVMKIGEKWVNGESRMISSWEVEHGRQVYVNDMDNKYCGKWMNLDEQEKEVGLELEVELWNSLLNELLLDLVS